MSLRMLWKLDPVFSKKVGRIQWEINFKPKWIAKVYHSLWWALVPGSRIKVSWPAGPVIKNFEDQYKSDQELFSSDPNDHYRPWLEQNVGRQGWDWDWALRDEDVLHNVLTIKFRKGKEKWSTFAAMKWS